MKFGVSWKAKGIRPEARETAMEAARRSGLSLDDWLNSVIMQQATQAGIPPYGSKAAVQAEQRELTAVNNRLDELSRRIERFTHTGAAAHPPQRQPQSRGPDQRAELTGRLDQYVHNTRPAQPMQPMQPRRAPAQPNGPRTPALDQALSEITARRQMLNGGAPSSPRRQPPASSPAAYAPPAARAQEAAQAHAPALLPAQDLSGLEEQLRKITNQIETLHQPGVEEAINALRAELGEIGHTLGEAMPWHSIETIEHQIQGLSQRIAEGRQSGVDKSALFAIEHGLVEVRDALRGLTPAEKLVGFNDAITGLAQKIDLIVAQRDPQTMAQLESAITTLRDMANHVASNDAVSALAAEVQALTDKIDYIAQASANTDALTSLEHRIDAFGQALAEQARNGNAVPPRLEALVQSLSDKIEQIQSAQQSHGDDVAAGRLDDRIAMLVERLDASDSRVSQLEAIERGLSDLLAHVQQSQAGADAEAQASEAMVVDALKHDLAQAQEALKYDIAQSQDAMKNDLVHSQFEIKDDIARTHDALNQLHGTIGELVSRLATIEQGIRSETRAAAPAPAVAGQEEEPFELAQQGGRVAVRLVDNALGVAGLDDMPLSRVAQLAEPEPTAPPMQPAQKPMAAGHGPIDPDLPPDQPIEPGSGALPLRANPAARITASEAVLGHARPTQEATALSGKSSFIAAARRAAQAAMQQEGLPVPAPEALDQTKRVDARPVRRRVMQRVKSLFVAASVVAIVVGSVQIATKSNMFNLGRLGTLTRATQQHVSMSRRADTVPEAPAAHSVRSAASPTATVQLPPRVAATPLALVPSGASINLLAPPDETVHFAAAPSSDPRRTAQSVAPDAKSAPAADITGSIPKAAADRSTQSTTAVALDHRADLPVGIGSLRLREAAAAGNSAAAYEVAMRFAQGRGVPANLTQAAQWYEQAAKKGLAPAQFRLASLLEKGKGVKKDLSRARALYFSAARQGHAKAMHNLAVLYAEGIDGKPDYTTAVQWFHDAAKHGVSDSQYNLGILYARGIGVEKSLPQSYKWFSLAAKQGDKEATKKRDEVASHMDAKALTAARHAVAEFVPAPQPRQATAVPTPPGGWDKASAARSPSVTTGTVNAIVFGKQ